MKILVVYYSRTGTTRKAAETIARKLGAGLEEIKDGVDRSGVFGYLKSGKEGMMREIVDVQPMKNNPADYDLVVVGTPIWAANLSSPVRSYLERNKDQIKRMAFFCTMGGTGSEKAKLEAEKILNQKVGAFAAIRTVDVVKNNFENEINVFAEAIEQPIGDVVVEMI